MDILTQQKFMKWVIAILIILNLSTLTFLWVSRAGAFRPGERRTGLNERDHFGDGRMMKFFKSELNLSDEQANEILKLRDEHQEKVRAILKEIHFNKKQIVDGIFENKDVNVDSISSEIGKLQSEIEVLTYNHLREMKGILGPDQEEIFKKLVGGFFMDAERQMPKRFMQHQNGKRKDAQQN